MKLCLIGILGFALSPWLTIASADDKLSAPFHTHPATDVSVGGIVLDNRDEFRQPPLTVECWARLHDGTVFNILVACDEKLSSHHWEFYTMAVTGDLAFWTPAFTANPDSGVPVCDDAWHYLAVVYEINRARLYVDGRLIKDEPLPPQQPGGDPGNFAIGQLVEGGAGVGYGCYGLIQDVRISRGVRAITGMPTAPFTKDATTLALWPLNQG